VGSLNPGATYVYEHVDGTIYAREFGSTERIVVGYELNQHNSYKLPLLWNDILKEAKNKPALQAALDNVIMLYRLSIDNPL